MATATGENLVTAIETSTGVTLNAVLKKSLTAKLNQMIANGTYSATAAAIATQAVSTEIKAKVDANGGTAAFVNNVTAVKTAVENGTTIPTFGSTTPTTPTFTLTTGVDAPELTANADTIEGVVSALSSEATLNATDKIDGGAGVDTLKAELKTDFAGFSSAGGLSNVENVELTNSGTIARNFNATGVSGVEKYTLNGAISLNNLADTKAAVVANDVAKGAVTVAYAAKVTDGTADTQAITVNNVGTADDKTTTTVNERSAVTVTANGIETLALTTAGTNIATLVGDKAATITVAGTGSLDTNVTATTTSFDASSNTGAVVVDTTAVTAANSLKTVATGAGDDTIKADVAALAINATINGGAGADRLELSGNGATTQYLMSGVETVSVGSITNSDLTFSAAKASGITTIEAAATFAGAGRTATFASLGSSDETFNLLTAAGATSAGTITADNSGASAINVTASAATIKAAVTGSSDTNAVALNLGNTSSVNLTVGQYANYTGTLTAGKATSVTANIAGALNNNIVAATATSAVINGTSTTASTLDLDAVKLTDLNVTAAGDFNLAAGSTLSAVERLTVNEAAGKTFTVGDLTAANVVNLSGAGSASLGALGAATQGYGITVNAEGLKDVTVGGLIQTAEAQAISVNAATVLGNVSLNGATVKADGSTATGSITVDANGTAGAVSTGTLTAAAVSVNAAGALKTLSTTIVADTATVTGAGLGVNTVRVTVTKAATVTGGIADDAFSLATDTDGATVSFDGGLGTSDVVTLTANSVLTNSSFNNVETLDLDTYSLQIDNATLANLVSSKTAVDLTGPAVLTVKGTDAADTIDASKVEVAKIAALTIESGKGNDTIKLGDAVETVKFAASLADNGKDTITGFTFGAANDVLDFSGFLGAAIDSTTGASTSLIDVDGTAGDVVMNGGASSAADANFAILYNATGTIADANVVGTATAAHGEIVMASNQKAVILVATSDAATSFNVYQVTAGSTAGTNDVVELVGVVSSANALSNFDASNVFAS